MRHDDVPHGGRSMAAGRPFAPVRVVELAAARSALEAGTGVVVVGRRGSGRSAFLRELVGRTPPVVRDRLVVGDPLESLHGDRLDRLARATEARAVVPVLSARTDQHLPQPLSALIGAGLLEPIELRPLPARGVLAVAETVLGGRLDAAAGAAFVPARGGSDLAVLATALRSARNSGVLALRGGVWTLTGAPPMDPIVRGMMLLGQSPDEKVDPETETLLDVLACTSLRLDVLIAVAAELGPGDETRFAAELERLEIAGTIEVVEGVGESRVRMSDGIIELLLPKTIGVLRRRRMSATLTTALAGLDPGALTADEVVALARHSVLLGRPVNAELLTRAARESQRFTDSRESLELARAAVDLGGGFDAEMVLASAELQVGESRSALQRLRRLGEGAAGDERSIEAVTVFTQQAIVGASDDRGESEVAPPDDADETSRLRRDALRGFRLFLLQDTVGAAALIEPALGVLDGDDYARAHYVLGYAAMVAGRLSCARDHLELARAVLTAIDADTSRIEFTRVYLDIFDGRIPEALIVVERMRDTAASFAQWTAQAICRWAVGDLLLFAGRADEAVGELTMAVESMESLEMTRAALMVRTDLATALSLCGRVADAQNALEPALHRDAPSLGLEGRTLQASAWILTAQGQTSQAIDMFVRASRAYGAHGFTLRQLLALVDAARVGGASAVIDEIDALAQEVEGGMVSISVRLASAMSKGDDPTESAGLAAEFDVIGDLAASTGLPLLAAEAYAHASSRFARAEDAREAAGARRRCDRQLAVCGLERHPFLDDMGATTLSDRERDIAERAARGTSNREIAEALVLSVRTVETHLQRVYAKLGVRRREELADALEMGRHRPR